METIARRSGPGRGGEAFTLLELIVVITILGILGTLVAVRVTPAISSSRRAKVQHDLKEIVRSARMIEVSTGSLPARLEELVQPVGPDGRPAAGGLDSIPLDPWGHPYGYEVRDGNPYAIWLGKDQQPGGEGEEADECYPPPGS